MGLGFNPANGQQDTGWAPTAHDSRERAKVSREFAKNVDRFGQEVMGTASYVIRNRDTGSATPAGYVQQSGSNPAGQAAPQDQAAVSQFVSENSTAGKTINLLSDDGVGPPPPPGKA